jgi:hypothetical protein
VDSRGEAMRGVATAQAAALSAGSPRTAAHDFFDVAAANAHIQQIVIRKLRQFAHHVSMFARSVSMSTPNIVLL